MKKVTKLSYLAMTILLVSCNEKVSPELLQSNNTAPATVAVPPEEYFFSVTNSSPVIQGYKLHKTGAGNKSAPCEVRNTTGLSNEIFAGDQTANDITCFFEAEELTLFHGGFSFDIGASKNSCEYVGYSPFGFYDWVPGNSSGEYDYVSCNTNIIDADVDTRTNSNGLSLVTQTADGPKTVGCGEYVMHDPLVIPYGQRETFSVVNEQELCRFDHSEDDGPNCDIGEITVNEYAISFTAGNPLAIPAEPDTWSQTKTSRKIKCGGKITNCISGPVAKMKTGVSKFTEITNTVLNQDFKKNYSYDSLIGKSGSVKQYTNYRRDLANKYIDFINSYSFETGFSVQYTGIWSAIYPLNRIFDPQVMDFYSNNRKLDGTLLITMDGLPSSPNWDLIKESVKTNQYFAMPYAADPILGIFAPVNPFYTFYCFDNAFDVKARIRMMVREWDRIFPSNSNDLELLSDLGNGASARMDSTVKYEVTDDLDSWIYMNDIKDWDDLIPMMRTPGSFNPSSTIWAPYGNSSYPDGFYNPSYFIRSTDKAD